MAPAATLAVFQLCCISVLSVLAAGSQDACDQYAAPGTSVTVPLKYTLKGSDNLKWYKDGTVIFHRRGTKLSKGKNDDVDSTGSLKLTKLTKEMSGRYNPEVYKEDGVSAGDLQSMRLCVIDRVKKPTVSRNCLNSKKTVSFTCSAGQGETFEWFMDDKKLVDKEKTLKREASEVAYNSFSCNVSNPISHDISLPVKQTCYEPSFPEELWGISIWVFVGGGAGVVLVLMLIVIICCIQTRRKRQMRLKDEREFRLDYANQHHQHHQQQQQQLQHQNQNHPDQHQHHQPPHHHRQQQPAGNTGPRQTRSKQQRPQQRPRAPEPPNGHPQPSPRRAAQATRPTAESKEEQPPPLPQPRKKKAPRE